MPVMNGLDAARELTKLMPNVPLIMFTNHTRKIMEEEAQKAGIRSLMSKDESYQKLISNVFEVLDLQDR
ncbi:MAG: Response regulator receiver domain [Acidobacteriaceae bacterium]|nr:Response regulator receiver domain [Acidobacteriaceae bacterium]